MERLKMSNPARVLRRVERGASSNDDTDLRCRVVHPRQPHQLHAQALPGARYPRGSAADFADGRFVICCKWTPSAPCFEPERVFEVPLHGEPSNRGHERTFSPGHRTGSAVKKRRVVTRFLATTCAG